MALTLHHQDSFDRANSELNGSTMSDGLGAWTSPATYDVLSNQARSTVADTIAYDSAMSAATTDQKADVKTAQADGGVVCRRVTFGSFAKYYLAYRDGSNKLNIYKNNGGSATDYALVAGPTAGSVANGDIITIQAVGTTIKAFINGVEVLSATDSAIAAGVGGMHSSGSGNHDFNDFADYIEAAAGSSGRLVDGGLVNRGAVNAERLVA